MRKHKRKAWTSQEARPFLESARKDDDRLYVLVLVLGLRKGEALGWLAPQAIIAMVAEVITSAAGIGSPMLYISLSVAAVVPLLR